MHEPSGVDRNTDGPDATATQPVATSIVFPMDCSLCLHGASCIVLTPGSLPQAPESFQDRMCCFRTIRHTQTAGSPLPFEKPRRAPVFRRTNGPDNRNGAWMIVQQDVLMATKEGKPRRVSRRRMVRIAVANDRRLAEQYRGLLGKHAIAAQIRSQRGSSFGVGLYVRERNVETACRIIEAINGSVDEWDEDRWLAHPD